MPLRLVAPDRGLVIAERLRVAAGPRDRMRGLLGHRELAAGDGLLLSPCKQVHTFGMRYPIDVVFCDRGWRVVGVVRAMRPGRVGRVVWRARHTVELPVDGAAEVLPGDRLRVEPLD